MQSERFPAKWVPVRVKKTRQNKSLVRNLDARSAWPVALDQREQRRRMRRVQPDAAMRSRTAEPGQIIGAVNGEAIIKEDRVRHRRIVVLPREPAPGHQLRMEYAARRAVAVTAGGNRPVVLHGAVNAHGHALGRLVDLDQHVGACWHQRQARYRHARKYLASHPPDNRFMIAPAAWFRRETGCRFQLRLV